MRLIRNFVLMIAAIFGASTGIILSALINAVGNLGLSFSYVFAYGLIGGVVFGWIAALFAFFLIRKWIRRKINYHATRIFNWSNNRFNRFR